MTMERTVRIGSRKSRLAVIQTELIAALLRSSHPGLRVEIVTMDTSGDRLKDRPLDDVGGKGLFTLELEQALRAGGIDLSVHSLKDMTYELPDDLPVLAYSRREDPRDALVLPQGETYRGLERLPQGKPVGCSSLRRRMQLLDLCPGIRVEPVRGNVLTRLNKLDSGEYGALVLAAAGLRRLGLAGRISHTFSAEEMLPAAGQGILAVQGRRGFDRELIACADDPDGRTAARAERTVVAALGCGCSSPAAAYCTVNGGTARLRALYADPETGGRASGEVSGAREEITGLAEGLAARLRKEASLHG